MRYSLTVLTVFLSKNAELRDLNSKPIGDMEKKELEGCVQQKSYIRERSHIDEIFLENAFSKCTKVKMQLQLRYAQLSDGI